MLLVYLKFYCFSEYSQQQATTAKLVEELESRINSLTADSDRTREEKFDLERRNMELEYECRTLNDGFLELKSRLEKFEHKYVDTVDSMRKDKQVSAPVQSLFVSMS